MNINFKRIFKNKVFGNAGWIIGCKLVKALLTLITTMILARYLGVANYGLINYAAGLVAFVAPVMKLGIDSILVHEIVVKPENEGQTLGTTIVLNVISSILCIVGITTFVIIANYGEKETIIVCFCYSLLLLFQAIEMIYYWFQAKLMAKYSSIAMLVSYIVVAIVQCLLAYIKANIYCFALSYSIDYMLIAGMLFVLYKKKASQKMVFSIQRAKSLLSVSRHYIVSSLMVTIFSQTDKIMLTLMINNEATGIYSAASVCAGMTSFVFAAIIDSMRPGIFAAMKKDKKLFEYKLSRLYSIIIYFSLLQCMIITIFATLIVYIIYGIAYVEAVNVLRIVVWFTTFSYIGSVRNIWILAENKQKYLWIINLSGAILNILLNFTLIPIIGVYGAAIASLITQIFANLIIGYIIRPIRHNNSLIIKGLHPRYIIDIFRQ